MCPSVLCFADTTRCVAQAIQAEMQAKLDPKVLQQYAVMGDDEEFAKVRETHVNVVDGAHVHNR